MSFLGILPIVATVTAVIAVACTGAPAAPSQTETSTQTQSSEPSPTPLAKPTVEPTQSPQASTPTPEPTSTPAISSSSGTAGSAVAEVSDAPRRLTSTWPNTDFSKHSVPFFEIISGGVPRDGIPPIDNPVFVGVSETPDYMQQNDPVIALELNGESKAYPLDMLQGHEIVNDELAGIPVTVTYCPLCNTAIVFDRSVDGRVFDFGVSGNLRNSDLIMWDRQTESWWQQITGESIVGEMTGTQLEIIPAPVISWGDFASAFPDGQLLSRDSGFGRNYDDAPYDGYDELSSDIPFLFINDNDVKDVLGGEFPEEVIGRKLDRRLRPMERVVSLNVEGQAVAYPFMLLEEVPVVNDTIGSQDVVVFYVGGTLSAFEGTGGSSNRIVGSTGVYSPFVDSEKLSFKAEGGAIVDESTGSRWSILGKAIEGPLTGKQLTPIVHANHFWFAWAAFNPDTEVREASDFEG